jgi:hypothetical protein
MINVLCGKAKNGIAVALRVRKLQDTDTLNVVLETLKFDETSVNTLQELLNNVVNKRQCININDIADEAKNIAAKSRRGNTNKLLASNKFIDTIDSMGNFSKLLPYIEIIKTNTLPEGEALLFYRGFSESDAPFFCNYDGANYTFKPHPDFNNYVTILTI